MDPDLVACLDGAEQALRELDEAFAAEIRQAARAGQISHSAAQLKLTKIRKMIRELSRLRRDWEKLDQIR